MPRFSITFSVDGSNPSASQAASRAKPELTDVIQIKRVDKPKTTWNEEFHQDNGEGEEKLFIQHFELLLSNSSIILGNPRYRNIIFPGLFISSAWVSRQRPLTLDELYYHWKAGEFITHDCCGSVYVYSAGGSVLSGSHRYNGYCRSCGKVYFGQRSAFSKLWQPYFHNPPDFLNEPLDCTIEELVADLLTEKHTW